MEIEISISKLILTHANILRVYGTMISILYKMGENNGSILHITVVVAIFCYLWWQEHWLSAIGNRNEHIWTNINSYKYIRTLYENDIHTLQNGSK